MLKFENRRPRISCTFVIRCLHSFLACSPSLDAEARSCLCRRGVSSGGQGVAVLEGRAGPGDEHGVGQDHWGVLGLRGLCECEMAFRCIQPRKGGLARQKPWLILRDDKCVRNTDSCPCA